MCSVSVRWGTGKSRMTSDFLAWSTGRSELPLPKKRKYEGEKEMGWGAH